MMTKIRQSLMHNTKFGNAAGFTLVELMVVVAIIGILTAVAAPRVQAFRARGIQSEAKANLSSIFLAQVNFNEAAENYARIGQCLAGVPCNGADGAGFAYRTNTDAKYFYGGAGGGPGVAGWSAGASSRGLILNGVRDQWRINANRVLCTTGDAVRNNFVDCVASSAVAAGTGIPDYTAATDDPQ